MNKSKQNHSLTLLAICLLGLGITACSNSDDTVEERGIDTLQKEQRLQKSDVSESIDEVAAQRTEPTQTSSASIHRTVNFIGDGVRLDQRAAQSLTNVAQALNQDLPTYITVRMVDPNDVSEQDVSALGERRAEAVQAFLQEQGVTVAEMRVEIYSSREYEAAQSSQALQGETETTFGLSELRDVDQTVFVNAEQEAVITVVTADP